MQLGIIITIIIKQMNKGCWWDFKGGHVVPVEVGEHLRYKMTSSPVECDVKQDSVTWALTPDPWIGRLCVDVVSSFVNLEAAAEMKSDGGMSFNNAAVLRADPRRG